MLSDEIKDLRRQFLEGSLEVQNLEKGIREFVNSKRVLTFADVQAVHDASLVYCYQFRMV